MRRFTLISAFALIATMAFAGPVKSTDKLIKQARQTKPYVSVLGQKGTPQLSLSSGSITLEDNTSTVYRASADIEPIDSVQGADAYGWLTGPDGLYWTYSQTLVEESYYYTSSEITVYDENHDVVGTISIDSLHEKTNMVEPYGIITKNLFDLSTSSYEMLVFINHVGDNYTSVDSVFVYNMDGEVVNKFPGNGTIFTFAETAYSNFQRFISWDYVTVDSVEYFEINVYKSGGYSGGVVLEHTWSVPSDNLNYMSGPVMTYTDVDGEPYYILSYYAEPYTSGYDDDYDLIITEDNSFLVLTYDGDYNLVDSVAVPIECPDNAVYRFAAFGMFGDCDFSKNYFVDNDEFMYIISYYDYVTSQDEYIYSFDLYDRNSNYITTIIDSVYTEWYSLAEIDGLEDQMTFLQITSDDSQCMTMVDLPSCNKVVSFPAYTDGERISSTLNRWPTSDGDYQYIISMGSASSNSDGDVIARAGWYNKDTTLDHFVEFNLGSGGENFTMNLNSPILTPYLINTDDAHEYAYLAKIDRDDDSGTIETVLVIADGDGEPMLTVRGDDDKSISLVSFINIGTTTPEIAVVYRYDDWTYDVDTYSLPFSSFEAGGSGTSTDPYLISTAGDMFQMEMNQTAHYKLVNDIDMSLANTSWRPLDYFSGSLDGDGYTIYNFWVNSEKYHTGLFYQLANSAKVKNLVFVEPKIDITRFNAYAGVIAGNAMGDSLLNIHIYDAQFNDLAGSTSIIAGGIAGSASLYSTIESCSFDGMVTLPAASDFGGIVGDARTGTAITACATSGSYTASTSLGGIVGSTGKNISITDCKANVTLAANNDVGGIVGGGSERPTITNCHAQGSVEATDEGWYGYCAGGIVGNLASDWDHSSTIIISSCVSDVDIVLPETAEADSTVHRIIGRTIANEDYDEDETVYYEMGIASNYATSDVTVGGVTIVSSDSASVEGASVDAADYVQSFFEALGYVYLTDGNGDKDNPWKGESGLPLLYFEEEAKALTISSSTLSGAIGDTLTLTATVWGTEGDDIDFTSSDDAIAVVEITDIDGGTATVSIECLAAGETTITATSGDLSKECTVTIAETTAIEGIVADGDRSLAISYADGMVSAAGARSLMLYNIGGMTIAKTAGTTIATTGMTPGLYIIIATDPEGNTATKKIVIK